MQTAKLSLVQWRIMRADTIREKSQNVLRGQSSHLKAGLILEKALDRISRKGRGLYKNIFWFVKAKIGSEFI